LKIISESMKPVPVSLQTYSLRDDMKADFARTLAEVGRIGYAGVELASHRTFDAEALKTAIDNAGLKVSGLTLGYTELQADLNAAVSEALFSAPAISPARGGRGLTICRRTPARILVSDSPLWDGPCAHSISNSVFTITLANFRSSRDAPSSTGYCPRRHRAIFPRSRMCSGFRKAVIRRPVFCVSTAHAVL
jgi:hypothetical protein